MDHFAGLDVSVKETSICIVDDTGRIVRVPRRSRILRGPLCTGLCCKSPKTLCDYFSAKRRTKRRSPIVVSSGAPAKLPVS